MIKVDIINEVARAADITKVKAEVAVEAVLEAMWEEGENMGDNAVAARVLTAAGLDGPAIIEKTQDPAIKAKLIENTDAAVELLVRRGAVIEREGGKRIELPPESMELMVYYANSLFLPPRPEPSE